MTDIEFIKATKKACIDDIQRNYSDPTHYKYVAEMVWYCYTLGNYKAVFSVYDTDCILSRRYEATYVRSEDKLMIDRYECD